MQIPTRAKRVGLEWCDCEPLASWVCWPVRRTGSRVPREGTKRNRGGSALLAALCGAWLLRNCLWTSSGSFASNGETTTWACSYRAGVSRTIGRFFCAKKGRAADTGACYTRGRRLATHANEYSDGRSFDAIFNILDGEAAAGIHDSGVRDIKMEAPRNRYPSRFQGWGGSASDAGEFSMASATSARQRRFRETRSTITNREDILTHEIHCAVQYRTPIPSEQVAGNADNDVQDGAVVAYVCRRMLSKGKKEELTPE